MKKITGFVFAVVFSSSALANDKDDILELCSIAKKGNFSQIQAKWQIQADGSIKLATLGGKGEVSFSKGSWDGIQQVLKLHQATDNVTARDCVIKLMPYFKRKVPTVASKAIVAQPKKAKSVVSAKPAAEKTDPVKQVQPVAAQVSAPAPAENSQDTQTVGNVTGDQNVIQKEVNGDVNINFGSKP